MGDGGGDAVSGADMGGESADLEASFLRFIEAPENLLKGATMVEGSSTQPREVYWAGKGTPRTICPEQRLENNIKTYKIVPDTFKAMADAVQEDSFIIIDRSDQARQICTSRCMLTDPSMSNDALRGRYKRLCVHSDDHDPYGKTDPSERFPHVRRSGRKPDDSLPQNTPSIPPAMLYITQGAVPCLSGILRAVDVYSTWAFSTDAKNIFQKLKEDNENSSGDTLRKEIKLDLLPKVESRLPDELDEHFYDRLAGRAWLLVELGEAYTDLYQVLTLTDVHCSLDPIMASTLYADATKKPVGRQDQHTDKRPEDKVRAYATLSSVSSARVGKANIGIKRNSASNIKKLLVLRRHFPRFCVLFEGIMGRKQTMEVFEIGWNIVCKLFKDENPCEFKVMSDVEIELLPFEYLVFDTDLIHWGGPYCLSGYLNLRYHL